VRAEPLVGGLCFGEGPRWHRNRLWLSDMHAHRVLTVTEGGQVETVVEVPNQPSGLGFPPDGTVLVVSMTDRSLLRFDGRALSRVADLSGLASWYCNDMVVDRTGRAYIGNFGFDLHARAQPKPAELIAVEPNGAARIVARELEFPNGTVITPDGKTLIVGESVGRRLTAFDVDASGDLSNRRVWAEMPRGEVPDGICLDTALGIWVASPLSNECLRVEQGGRVTHRIPLERGAFACMLGGSDRRNLYILTATSSEPEVCRKERSGRVEVARAPYPAAGLP
jgi:sugar lactone lactonase YvrE